MENIRVVLHKEWLELRQQRGMLLSTLALPVLFTVMPLVILIGVTLAPAEANNTGDLSALLANNPLFAGMNEAEATQASIGLAVSTLPTLLPMILPSILASYSVVGEKNNRTLEPILATPIKTWELLVGKGLASLLPSLLLTWASAAIFATGATLSALSPRVAAAIVSPGWVALLVVCTPLIAAIATAGMVIISSRVNDPRTAQQYSAVGIVPFMVLIFGQLAGLLVLNVVFALLAAVVLAALAAAMIWFATRVFQRETILTRWK